MKIAIKYIRFKKIIKTCLNNGQNKLIIEKS